LEKRPKLVFELFSKIKNKFKIETEKRVENTIFEPLLALKSSERN
jgi:hypothetical protein